MIWIPVLLHFDTVANATDGATIDANANIAPIIQT